MDGEADKLRVEKFVEKGLTSEEAKEYIQSMKIQHKIEGRMSTTFMAFRHVYIDGCEV